MSKHGVSAGNVAALLMRLSELKQKAFARTGKSFHVIAIQEAGLDGFWIHRVLRSEGVESHVVDPASIATSRRRRRAKTDKMPIPTNPPVYNGMIAPMDSWMMPPPVTR
jgi:transposase